MKLNKEADVLVIIDMINGFIYEGNMASSNATKIIPGIKKLVEQCLENGVKVVHYIDSHPEDAQEFKSYPVHCIAGSNESKPVTELDYPEIEKIYKNSTNGFFAKNPFDYKKNIYICGVVTDICIFEFALTSQKYKEEHNLPYSINVINSMTTTFDAPAHDAKEIHKQFINILESRSINIID